MALGAFLAGLVIGQSEFSARAASEALPMRDAFAVLFFVSMGMLLDPGQILPNARLIAAAVVAGIYGARAVEALDRARAAQGKINELAASLAADANLMTAINSAQIGMNRIVADVAAAGYKGFELVGAGRSVTPSR